MFKTITGVLINFLPLVPILLKLTGVVTWPWVWVLLPIWLPLFVLFLFCILLFVIAPFILGVGLLFFHK